MRLANEKKIIRFVYTANSWGKRKCVKIGSNRISRTLLKKFPAA